MRDLELGVTTMIGVNIDGEAGNSNTGGGGISADGLYAGVFSNATDLLPPGEDDNAVRTPRPGAVSWTRSTARPRGTSTANSGRGRRAANRTSIRVKGGGFSTA
jgi:hypothetical protein